MTKVILHQLITFLQLFYWHLVFYSTSASLNSEWFLIKSGDGIGFIKIIKCCAIDVIQYTIKFSDRFRISLCVVNTSLFFTLILKPNRDTVDILSDVMLEYTVSYQVGIQCLFSQFYIQQNEYHVVLEWMRCFRANIESMVMRTVLTITSNLCTTLCCFPIWKLKFLYNLFLECVLYVHTFKFFNIVRPSCTCCSCVSGKLLWFCSERDGIYQVLIIWTLYNAIFSTMITSMVLLIRSPGVIHVNVLRCLKKLFCLQKDISVLLLSFLPRIILLYGSTI